jgi:hypothetical protein
VILDDGSFREKHRFFTWFPTDRNNKFLESRTVIEIMKSIARIKGLGADQLG